MIIIKCLYWSLIGLELGDADADADADIRLVLLKKKKTGRQLFHLEPKP